MNYRSVQYIIGLTDYNLESLKRRIAEKIKAGYEQSGHINATIMNHYGDKKYAVKMVKYKEENHEAIN